MHETEPPHGLATLLPFSNTGSDCFLLESIFERDVWMHMCFPVSDQNEAAVCTAMIAGAQEALTGYPTTIDEDLVQLRSGACAPGSRQEAAVRVSDGCGRVVCCG